MLKWDRLGMFFFCITCSEDGHLMELWWTSEDQDVCRNSFGNSVINPLPFPVLLISSFHAAFSFFFPPVFLSLQKIHRLIPCDFSLFQSTYNVTMFFLFSPSLTCGSLSLISLFLREISQKSSTKLQTPMTPSQFPIMALQDSESTHAHAYTHIQ